MKFQTISFFPISLAAVLLLPALLPQTGFAQSAPPISTFTNALLTADSVDSTRAVSEINGKLSYEGGTMNSAFGNNFDGSIAIPVFHQFGFQADGLYSKISNLSFYSGAGHFFWRDPQIGLLGITGGYLDRLGVDTYQVGVEGEYYWRRFTFGAFGGVGSISYKFPTPFINTNPTQPVGRISAGVYPIDNLLLSASYATEFHDNLVQGELEYQTPIRGLALTAEAAYGSHGYDHLLFGIRYYFGRDKSLIDRHRHDDPPGLVQQMLYGLGLYGAEYNRKENQYIDANPGSGNSGGGGGGGDYGSVDTTITAPPPIINGGGGGITITGSDSSL